MKICPRCIKYFDEDEARLCLFCGTTLLDTQISPNALADTLKPASASERGIDGSGIMTSPAPNFGVENSKILQEEITRAIKLRDRGIYNIRVANVEGAQMLTEELKKQGFVAEIHDKEYIYNEQADDLIEVKHTPSSDESQAIWLANNIHPAIAVEAILIAVRHWPFLRYVLLSSEFVVANDNHSELFFGGSTEEAVETYKLEPWEETDFEGLRLDMTINDFHDYVRKRYSIDTHLNFVRI